MKKILIGLLTLLSALAITGCGGSKDGAADADAKVNIGMTVQSLSNPTWAGYCQAIEKEVKAQGASINYVACDSNVGKQITQIENFISSGVDVIIIHPADPKGVEFALKQARDAGIKVLAWDDNLENADLAWLIDNRDLGYTIGTHAAAWINEKLGGTAEVAILNYPQLPILLERGNGIRAAITELAPMAKVVAESSAIDTKAGIEKMETIFQSNPNVKVVCSIGGGGSVGANEAAKAANKNSADFGIFAADATQPELSALKNNEGVRMTVTVTGTNQDIANEIWDMVTLLQSGEPIAAKEIYREFIPVTKDNVDQFFGK
ncbi:MAG: sugar ABC transporter substrate-binding protein [Opitutaceae bacterium]